MIEPWETEGMSNRDMLIAVEKLKHAFVARATGEAVDEDEYPKLRRQVLALPVLKSRLPRCVETCHTLGRTGRAECHKCR